MEDHDYTQTDDVYSMELMRSVWRHVVLSLDMGGEFRFYSRPDAARIFPNRVGHNITDRQVLWSINN